jgi:hypothetical protein
LNSVAYALVPAWLPIHSYAPGALVRQTAPAVGGERVFANVTASTINTTNSNTEPTWVLTKGFVQASDGGLIWQECTGQPGINGDIGFSLGSTTLHNTPTWTEQHNSSTTITAGLIIQDNASGSVALWIAKTVAGVIGASAPAGFSTATAGTSVLDNGNVTWISLGLASSFGTWAAPFARMQSVVAAGWMAFGQICYVSNNHAETQSTAAMTINFPQITSTICVDHTVSLPPTSSNVTTGATVTTTGNNALTITVAGNSYAYIVGVTFQCGTGAVAPSLSITGQPLRMENCALQKLGTTGSVTAMIWTGLDLINTTVKFGSTADAIRLNGTVIRWRNTPNAIDATGSIPTTLAFPINVIVLVWDGLDLTGPSTIIGQNYPAGQITNCTISAGALIGATLNFRYPVFSDSMFCDSSGGTAPTYQHQRASAVGTSNAVTNVYRTGGASNGVVTYSWRFDSSANLWYTPFECFPIVQWNTVTGSNRTITVYGVILGQSTLPLTDAIWMEVEYMGSSSSPIVTKATTGKVNYLATGTTNTLDTVSQWNGPARLANTSYPVTATQTPMSVSTNPGQLFYPIAPAGTTFNGAPPSAYAPGGVPVADGASVTDGTSHFQAGYRFSMSLTVTPQLVGDIVAQVYINQSFVPVFIDPRMVLS